jgi:hypothetical protein
MGVTQAKQGLADKTEELEELSRLQSELLGQLRESNREVEKKDRALRETQENLRNTQVTVAMRGRGQWACVCPLGDGELSSVYGGRTVTNARWMSCRCGSGR